MTKSNRHRKPTVQFGRISANPMHDQGRPHIIWHGETGDTTKDIDVLDVIDDIRKGLSDENIYKKYPMLDDEDLLACRAWQARFMPETLTNVFNRHSRQNVVMLDENMSYKLLPAIVSMFGRSSHVYADGLVRENNDDEAHIWGHAVGHGYKAIITKDDDFVGISARHRRKHVQKYGAVAKSRNPLPVVIIVKQNNRDEILRLLEKHREDILKFIKDNDAIYAELTPTGFHKGPKDPKPFSPGNSNDNRNMGPSPP